jgi:hypothetical protein
MIELFVFCLVSMILLAFVALLLRSSLADSSDDPCGLEPGASSIGSSIDTPPRILMERLFSEDDLRFISEEGSQGALTMLLRERRRVALAWIRQTRRQASSLVRAHLRNVRADSRLDPFTEMRLFLHVSSFMLLYAMLFSLIWGVGAFRTPPFVRKCLRLAHGLGSLGDSILSDVGGPELRTVESR